MGKASNLYNKLLKTCIFELNTFEKSFYKWYIIHLDVYCLYMIHIVILSQIILNASKLSLISIQNRLSINCSSQNNLEIYLSFDIVEAILYSWYVYTILFYCL